MRKLCEWKWITIIEADVYLDYIYMLVEIPQKYAVSSVMVFLKGKSGLMIYQQWSNMRYQYRNREFWCRGYIGKNTKKIKEYIANQLKEDQLSQQITLDDFDPFIVASRKCNWWSKKVT